MSTKSYRAAAHDAMRPLYLACIEELDSNGTSRELPESSVGIVSCVTVGGATIMRVVDVVSVEGEFETFTKKGKPAEELVEITFPKDMRDLADSKIDRTLTVGDYEGISGGSVGIRDYTKYARDMMELVRPMWVNESA